MVRGPKALPPEREEKLVLNQIKQKNKCKAEAEAKAKAGGTVCTVWSLCVPCIECLILFCVRKYTSNKCVTGASSSPKGFDSEGSQKKRETK